MTNIAFDGKGEWSFGNDTPRKFELFRADNSSSFHTDNLKIDFLIFGEALTFGASEKTFGINFSKAETNFCLSFHYNIDNS